MLAPSITLPHFSVSSARSFPNSEGEVASTAPPTSVMCDSILASSRARLISLLSLSTISAGVFFGVPMCRTGGGADEFAGDRPVHFNFPRRRIEIFRQARRAESPAGQTAIGACPDWDCHIEESHYHPGRTAVHRKRAQTREDALPIDLSSRTSNQRFATPTLHIVMAGLVSAIHARGLSHRRPVQPIARARVFEFVCIQGVDARHKSGHDGGESAAIGIVRDTVCARACALAALGAIPTKKSRATRSRYRPGSCA